MQLSTAKYEQYYSLEIMNVEQGVSEQTVRHLRNL